MKRRAKSALLVIISSSLTALVIIAAYALFMVLNYTGQRYYLPLLFVATGSLMILIPATFFRLFRGKIRCLWGMLFLVSLIYTGAVMVAFTPGTKATTRQTEEAH